MHNGRAATACDYDLYHSLQDSDFAGRFQFRIALEFPPSTHPCVLDFGCGRGHAVKRFIEAGHEAHGVDVSCVALAFGSQRLGIPQERLRHIQPHAALPYPEHFFDLVFSADVMEHLPLEEVPYALAELGRVCRGTMVFSICFREAETLRETGLRWHPTVRPRAWWRDEIMRFTNFVEIPGWESGEEPNLLVFQRPG